MRKRKLFNILILLFSGWLVMEGVSYLIICNAIKKIEMGLIEPKAPELRKLKSENTSLKKRLNALRPKDIHILVDTAENILYLQNGEKNLLKATISCGSGGILIDPFGQRKWIFETPRGEFTVLSKHLRPVWVKPDWAFIEEGKSIPKNFIERIEEGTLGDYALGFGNGYFIHGTLYTRLLGKNVTHGCIRLNDKDLKILYETVPLGTKILIF